MATRILGGAAMLHTLFLLALSESFVTPRILHYRRIRSARSARGDSNHGGGDPPIHRRLPPQDHRFDAPLSPWIKSLPANHTDAAESSLRGGGSGGGGGGGARRSASAVPAQPPTHAPPSSSLMHRLTSPIRLVRRKLASLFTSKQNRQDAAYLEQLRIMPVKAVTTNSTILPHAVVQTAARQHLLGHSLQLERVQDMAVSLKEWYMQHGYVLHKVTGATLAPKSATARIEVVEPIVASPPLEVVLVREVVLDRTSGRMESLSSYQRKQRNNKNKNVLAATTTANVTLVPAKGRIATPKLAAALALQPGAPFCWQLPRWQALVASGLFGKDAVVTPRSTKDGTVQVQILATPAPALQHVEYGIGKSLYTGVWEGELDWQHNNIFGGGERMGVSVKRRGSGNKEELFMAKPSVTLHYADDRFGLGGGYNVQVFADAIGENTVKTTSTDAAPVDFEMDNLSERQGATLNMRHPFARTLEHSVTIGYERTGTQMGLHEQGVSTSMSVGPIVQALPGGIRSSMDAVLGIGCRRRAPEMTLDGITDSVLPSCEAKHVPYASGSFTLRHLIPLLRRNAERPLVFGIRNSLTMGSTHLPRHEALRMGVANSIRGRPMPGALQAALRGGIELRFPFQLPEMLPTAVTVPQDASLVLFGDYLLARPRRRPEEESRPVRQTSVGIGLRKSIQGLPLQFDLSYGNHRIKASVGLGRDFEF